MLIFVRIFIRIRAKTRRPHGSVKGGRTSKSMHLKARSILGKGRPRMAPSMMRNNPNIQTEVAGIVVP